MALFDSPAKDVLRRLSGKVYSTTDERDELLARLEALPGLQPKDVVWMWFRPDRTLRDSASRVLQKLGDPMTVDAFLAESAGKPEAATRAAAAALFAANIPRATQRIADILAGSGTSKQDFEARDAAARLMAEVPVSRTTEPLLWQLENTADGDLRLRYLDKLATLDLDANSAKRWQKLATDPVPEVRDRAIQVLAARAPEAALPILAKALPSVNYTTRQSVIDVLARLASTRGMDVAEQVIPLLGSGDAAMRTAVLKVLMSVPDRRGAVRRYIELSKTMASFVRERALGSLRDFGDELIDPVLALLDDPDDDIRAAAVGIAATIEDKRFVPAIIGRLKDRDWWVRVAAADMLGRLKDAHAVDPLIAALGDADVRWSAVEALGRIGDARALPPLGRLLADPQPEVRIEVMQALRNFKHPQVLQALTSVASKDPERNVRARAIELIDEVSQRDHSAADVGALRSAALAARSGASEPRLNRLLIATRNQGGSDLHLSTSQPPIVRIAASLLRVQGEPFTAEQSESVLREALTDAQWATLQRQQQIDFCYSTPQGGRYRANVFVDQRGLNAVFRLIPDQPPTISEVGLPPQLAHIADYHQGLVLICGPSGSGKSTTLAALVNLFNETRSAHILTVEDPVEFIHPFKNCLINQRELNTNTESYARALRAALREDPDVIVIGELRDNETVSLALTAAETGHIVLGTLSSTTAPKALDRIISSFPVDEQPQVRTSMSESLKYVIAQRLLPAREARKRVAVFEILKGNSNIGSMIRDEKTYQIFSAMQIGRSLGMQTFDDGLKDLVQRGQITAETAYLAAQKKEDFESMVSAGFLEQAEL